MTSVTYIYWILFRLPLRLKLTLSIGYYEIFLILIVHKVKMSGYPIGNLKNLGAWKVFRFSPTKPKTFIS
jgi:hypothetical protein